MPLRTRAPRMLAAVVAGLLLAGCSGDGGDPNDATPAQPAETAAPAAADTGATAPDSATGPEPLVLTTSSGDGQTCFTWRPSRGDLAWFDVQWRATTRLESFSFALVDPVGVRSVGSGEVIPPVNFGGRIDYSGSAWWPDRRSGYTSSQTAVRGVDDVAFWVPLQGQTGLVSLRLRFDPGALAGEGGATITGLVARYTLPDGSEGETSLATDLSWRSKGC